MKKQKNKTQMVICPRYSPPALLLIGGFLEVSLFSVSLTAGYFGIFFLLIGAWMLWK